MTGSHGKYMFIFLKNCQAVLQSAVPFYIPTSNSSTSSPIFDMISFSKFPHFSYEYSMAPFSQKGEKYYTFIFAFTYRKYYWNDIVETVNNCCLRQGELCDRLRKRHL